MSPVSLRREVCCSCYRPLLQLPFYNLLDLNRHNGAYSSISFDRQTGRHRRCHHVPPSVHEDPNGELTRGFDRFLFKQGPRNEQQNTLVFNFTNSKKDVSHIENDGLDLSKRKKQANKVKYSLTLNDVNFCHYWYLKVKVR